MRLQGGNALLGLDSRYYQQPRTKGPWSRDRAHHNDFYPDAHDFYNTKFLDNSSSGIGGWGDPTNDYQIFTGGLKDMIVAYPTPHHLRRNFTLYPYAGPSFPPPWGNDPSTPPPPADLMINTTFRKGNVDYIVNSYEGDYIGFQAYCENTVKVSLVLPLLVFQFAFLTLDRIGAPHRPPLHPRWVSTL